MAKIDTRQLDDFDETGWIDDYIWQWNASTENWEAVNPSTLPSAGGFDHLVVTNDVCLIFSNALETIIHS